MLIRLVRSLLITATTSAALAAAQPASADVKGIPYTDRFPTASFPYARVLTGCTEWRHPAQMGDKWSVVDFAGACVTHDQCFYTPGSHWGDCNQKFQSALHAACDRDLERARLTEGRAGRPDPQALELCYSVADLYAAEAQRGQAVERFREAQTEALAYQKYVRGVVDRIYRSVLHRAATSKEMARAFDTLAQDYSLDDLKAALMGTRLEIEASTLSASGPG